MKRPAKITIGLEVKRCSECDRGDCGECAYKYEFERLLSLPNCNDCKHGVRNTCGHCPGIGGDVRINCPLWTSKKEDASDAT